MMFYDLTCYGNDKFTLMGQLTEFPRNVIDFLYEREIFSSQIIHFISVFLKLT